MSNDNKPLSERLGDFINSDVVDGYFREDALKAEIAALEQRLSAAEAEKQSAVDAALESVRAQLQALALKCGWDTNSSAYAADQILAEAIGTNPLTAAGIALASPRLYVLIGP